MAKTPLYTLRLPQKTQDDLADISRIYGATSPRAFAREILEVATSGDLSKLQAFAERLMKATGEQLMLFASNAAELPRPRPGAHIRRKRKVRKVPKRRKNERTT
jgi:hypothetical protein